MGALYDMRTDIKVSNKEFLEAIFGDEWGKAHVTAFADDPSNIVKDRREICWGGGSARRLLDEFSSAENQYFTISLFNSPRGSSVRQKAKFDACFVIVADDVNEKLPKERVEQLPLPSYKLFTSANSEQWAWILDPVCSDRERVDNLLDGLVAKGLAPQGVDPGMKGVTRYVRLPGGSNTKAKRLDEKGNPFKCYLSAWNPERTFTIEQLAEVFDIDLDAPRNEVSSAVASSTLIANHPLIKNKILNITGEGNDGWIRIDCPNVAAHTDDDPAGAAIRISDNLDLAIKCHHGHCSGEGGDKLTPRRLLNILEKDHPGLIDEIEDYKRERIIAGHRALASRGLVAVEQYEEGGEDQETEVAVEQHTPKEKRRKFNLSEWIYMVNSNTFYDLQKNVELSSVAFDNLFLREMPKKPKAAEQFCLAMDDEEVGHGYTWIPQAYSAIPQPIYRHNGQNLVNRWGGFGVSPMPGSVDPWLDLLDFIIRDDYLQDQVVQWLAYLVQSPHKKCQWQLLFRGQKGTGKDSLFAPIMRILNGAGGDVPENVLDIGWGDYFAERKLVVFQEIHHPDNRKFSNSLKNICAGTGSGMATYNLKGGKVVRQPDVLAAVLMSNFRYCLPLEKDERRYLVLDSFYPKAEVDAAVDDGLFRDYWNWVDDQDGASKLLNYLFNVDLSGFDPSRVPVLTKGYYDLVEGGKHDYEVSIEDMAESREGVFSLRHFEFKTFKNQVKTAGYSMGDKGLREVLERLGYAKYRGTKKIGGSILNTPSFYTNAEIADFGPSAIYDWFQET